LINQPFDLKKMQENAVLKVSHQKTASLKAPASTHRPDFFMVPYEKQERLAPVPDGICSYEV
jgi:hypothetical protein